MVASCSFIGLDPATPQKLKLNHQALAGESPPPAWLQGGTLVSLSQWKFPDATVVLSSRVLNRSYSDPSPKAHLPWEILPGANALDNIHTYHRCTQNPPPCLGDDSVCKLYWKKENKITVGCSKFWRWSEMYL